MVLCENQVKSQWTFTLCSFLTFSYSISPSIARCVQFIWRLYFSFSLWFFCLTKIETEENGEEREWINIKIKTILRENRQLSKFDKCTDDFFFSSWLRTRSSMMRFDKLPTLRFDFVVWFVFALNWNARLRSRGVCRFRLRLIDNLFKWVFLKSYYLVHLIHDQN